MPPSSNLAQRLPERLLKADTRMAASNDHRTFLPSRSHGSHPIPQKSWLGEGLALIGTFPPTLPFEPTRALTRQTDRARGFRDRRTRPIPKRRIGMTRPDYPP